MHGICMANKMRNDAPKQIYIDSDYHRSRIIQTVSDICFLG
jgi:hypothetical protein